MFDARPQQDEVAEQPTTAADTLAATETDLTHIGATDVAAPVEPLLIEPIADANGFQSDAPIGWSEDGNIGLASTEALLPDDSAAATLAPANESVSNDAPNEGNKETESVAAPTLLDEAAATFDAAAGNNTSDAPTNDAVTSDAEASATTADATTSEGEGTDEGGALAARRGRIELLPNEEIVYHLGALYLTNKRVLLYAPTVLRAAFLRDVDAMGTATERLPGWVFVLGLVMMMVAGLTGLLIFFDAHQELSLESPLKQALTNVRDFLPLPLEWLVWAVAALAVFFIVSYFLYLSKSLFVSVHGRPVITVSISGYRPHNLDDIDSFINALAAAKDTTMNSALMDE